MEGIAPNVEHLDICDTPIKLSKMYDYVNDYKRMMFNKSVPCVEQYATVAWNFVETKKAISNTIIKVLYPDIYYQEISYSSDFGLESVISNVGGFVGIFLGYSMMQFPDMIGKL